MRISLTCLFAAVLCCGCTDPEQAARTRKNQREMYEAAQQAMREAREGGMSIEEAQEQALKAQREVKEAQESAKRESD